MKYKELKKGNLGILVWWQSLDGRLEISYYGTFEEALEKYKHLDNIGRKPQMWHQIDVTDSQMTEAYD